VADGKNMGMSKTRHEQTRGERHATDPQKVLEAGLRANEEVRTVMEIAAQAREVISLEQPVSTDAMFDLRPTSTVSQLPALPTILQTIQTA
jgi:hypothetical protein